MRPRVHAPLVAGISAIVAALCGAVPAEASVLYVGDDYRAGQWVHYTAAAGEVNRVTVTLGVAGYTVSDPGATVTAGAGCTSVDAHTGVCALPSDAAPFSGVHAWLDDLADTYDTSAATRAVVEAGGGDDTISGGPGADELYGDAENDRLTGGDGADELYGGAGVNTLTAGAGDDVLWAGPGGTDALSGGDGTDTARYEREASTWPPLGVTASIDGQANDGNDGDGPAGARDNIGVDVENLIGSPGADTLTGDGADNHLDGLRGVDTLDGGGGDDRFTMYAAFESTVTINGGDGRDTVDLSESYDSGGGPIVLDGQSHGSLTIGTDVENAIGGNRAETIIGNASDNILDGGPGTCKDSFGGLGGNDTVSYAHARWPVSVSLDGVDNDGAHGWSQYCSAPDFIEGDHLDADIESLQGGPDNDVLTGNAAANTLDGAAGDDVLQGGAGADRLDGGSGQDGVDYGERTTSVTARLDGQPGSGDATDGPAGARDRLVDAEDVRGGSGDDVLVGNSADNTLDGGAGADVLAGLAGRDTVDYSGRADAVVVWLDGTPESGDDTDGPPLARDRISSDVEDVHGGSGDDLLVGSAAANRLSGGGGDDFLLGDFGADTLRGGSGDLDAVAYLDRDAGVDASLSGTPVSGNADDGPAGARDTIETDVEALLGGFGPDTLTGNGGDNLLNGGPGADRLSGAGGLDAADYSERTGDLVLALDGAPTSGDSDDGSGGARDRILPDIEALLAGSGNDALTGSPLPNYLDGGPGDDRIDSRDDDGDYDACGPGSDAARVDEFDLLDGCEATIADPPSATPTPTPTRTPTPTPTTSPRPTTTSTSTVRVPSGQTLRTVRRRGLKVELSCPGACTIDARLRIDSGTAKRLRLGRRAVTIGRAGAALQAAGTRTLTVRLTSRARSRLATARTLRATLQVTAAGRQIVRHLRLTASRSADHAVIARAAHAAAARAAPAFDRLLRHSP